jgi:aryl-alcohol dehydrogenase-like predicted oxidoreductase
VLAGRYRTANNLPGDSRAAQKGIYAERITDAGIKIARNVMEWAERKELSPTALSVSWILHQPAITSVIIGPRTPEHLDDLVSAQDIHLSPEDLDSFNTLVSPGTYVSDHFNTAGWRRPT